MEIGMTVSPDTTMENIVWKIVSFIKEKNWAKASEYVETAMQMDSDRIELYYLSLLINNKSQNDKDLINQEINLEDDGCFKFIIENGTGKILDRVKNIKREIAVRKKEKESVDLRSKYELAERLIATDSLECIDEGIALLTDLYNEKYEMNNFLLLMNAAVSKRDEITEDVRTEEVQHKLMIGTKVIIAVFYTIAIALITNLLF